MREKKNLKLELRLFASKLKVSAKLFFEHLYHSLRFLVEVVMYLFVLLGITMIMLGKVMQKSVQENYKKHKGKTLKLPKGKDKDKLYF